MATGGLIGKRFTNFTVHINDLNGTWASRTQHIEYPDYIWLDLDPTISAELKGKSLHLAEEEGFAKAIVVALAEKEIIHKHALKSFIKTSGL